MLRKLLQTKRVLFIAILMVGINAWGQLSLPAGTSYTQNFDGIGSGLPTGWSVRDGATFNSSTGAGTRGSTTTLLSAAGTNTAWSSTTGGFKNFAASDASLGSTASTANQTSATDRALGIRPSGSVGDPGASFELEIANTTGKTSFLLSLKHQLLDNQSRTQIYQLHYSTNGGTTWTALGTDYTTASAFGSTSLNYNFGTALDSKSSTVLIRVVTTASSTGSGSRDSYGIDDFVLSWTNAAASPTVTTNAAGTVTSTTAVLNGTANAANGSNLAVYFDYGLTTGYGTQVTETTPNAVTGNSNTAFTGTATGLTPNTTYNYRAAGNNGTAYNGSNATFVTLANVPGVPLISGATTSSLSVTLDSATQNSNPSTTQYAIQVTNSSLYVQANGALGAGVVWQTAGTWATRTVTGLESNTQYTFQVKARNSSNIETAFGATASGTTLANTSPLLSATTLNSFGSVCINTTTSANTFILDGENLTTEDVTVGPLAGFTFSTTSGGTYTSSLTLTPVGGSILTDIFVKFAPTAVQSYNGNIPVSGGGATAINVAAIGSGINTQATVTTTAVTTFTGTTATLGGDVTAQGCSTVTARGVVYATTATPVIGGGGVTNLADAVGGTGTFTVNATGLTGSTLYYVRAYATNGGGTVYGTQRQFTTTCTVPTNVTGVTSSTPASAQVTLSWTNGSCSDEVLVVAKATSAVTATPAGDGTAYTANAGFGLGTEIVTSEYVVYKGTGTTVTVTGLTNGTTYNFTIFTRRGTTWNAGVTKSQAAALVYCAASGTNSTSENIASVNFDGQTNTSAASSYTSYTNIVYNVSQYLSYPLTITLGGIPYADDRGLVWIDWNHDGDFDDTNETITMTNGSGVGPYTATITVPGNATVGTTRMRIRVTDSSGIVPALSACGTSSYGEVEDYSINIAAGVPPLSAPVATAATNTTASSFTANWNAVAGATSYKLDVYSSTLGTAEAAQGFASGSSAPTGWTFTGVDGTYTTAGNYGESSPSVRFNDSNDIILTETYPGNATSLSFWIKGQTATGSSLKVEGYNGSQWVQVDNILLLPNTGTVKLYNAASTPVLPAGLVRFRFTYTKVTSNLSFDDVKVNYDAITDAPVTGYNNLTVNGTSQVVSGLQSNTSYSYVVRALSPVSVNSNTISVLTGSVKIWASGAWNGDGEGPTLTDEVLINDAYNTVTNGTFNAAGITVNSPLTVASGTSITVNGGVSIGTGSMTVQSNANVIQIDDNADNSGSVTVERESPALKRLDYKIWSSPVSGQELFNFSTMTDPTRFYIYNTQTNQYNSIANSNDFGTGAGYLIRMPNDHNATTATKWLGKFTGVPHNGSLEVPVSYYAADDLANPALPIRGYNAIGNPYMSTISAGRFYQANADRIDGTFYFWNKTNGSAGTAYVAYTPGLGGTGNGTDAIQVGQGFIVNVTMPGADNVLFNNSMRVNNQSDFSYRMPVATANAASPQANEMHRYWLNLTNTAGANSQALVGYTGNATNGIDGGIDGKLLNDSSAALYTMAAGTNLMIQGRPLPFVTTDVVALGYKAIAAGNHKITLDHFDGIFADGQHIYLKDKVANVVHDLSSGAYTFATATGTFNDRFEVVYTTVALGTDDPVAASPENIAVYKDGNALNIAAGTMEIAGVAVYDIRGRLLYSNDSVNASETSITTLQAAQQVLVVQVTTVNNGKVSKKVVF